MIRWVGQEEKNGCGPACLAMMLGLSYPDARRLFLERFFEDHSFHNSGIDPVMIDVLLGDRGYAVLRRWPNERDPAWLEPFAPLHFAQLNGPTGGHFVVMLADGTVLDPAVPPPPVGKPLRLSGPGVGAVAGGVQGDVSQPGKV